MDAQAEGLQQRFLGWQCRLRQIAMRQGEGQPSDGMQPRVATDREWSLFHFYYCAYQ